MKHALVIGNGASRKAFDLRHFSKGFTETWGCNAIWRDFSPTNIVMADPQPIKEYIEHCIKVGIAPAYKMVIAKPHPLTRDCLNSGAYALLEAAKKYKRIVVIGFDSLLKNKKESVSNIYTYKGGMPSNCTDHFVEYFRRISSQCWDTEFNFVYPKEYEVHEECMKIMPANVTFTKATLKNEYYEKTYKVEHWYKIDFDVLEQGFSANRIFRKVPFNNEINAPAYKHIDYNLVDK